MMKVRIQTQGFTLTPPIAARVHDQLDRLLGRYGEEIISIDAYLKDLNGPKGGFDKLAVVRIRLRQTGPIGISTTHTDLYKAIDITARRCMRSVRRAVGRKKLIRRRGLQYIASEPLEA